MHRTLKDIVIPAGTEVDVDDPGTNIRYPTAHASITIAVTKDTTASWAMDLDEAIETGLVEEVPDEIA
jgi:hypothetical protein